MVKWITFVLGAFLVLALVVLARAEDPPVNLDLRSHTGIPIDQGFTYQYTVQERRRGYKESHWAPPIYCSPGTRCVFSFRADESPRLQIDGNGPSTIFVVPR